MKILYIGDIMARSGRLVVQNQLPEIKKKFSVDIVVAQAENVSHGVGMSIMHYKDLKKAGVDFFSGGNHSVERIDTMRMIADDLYPVIAPANMPNIPGSGFKILETSFGKLAFLSLLGSTFPKGYGENVENPLKFIDENIKKIQNEKPVAIVVNFHGDLSSEKRIIGYYLDGKVSMVVGDHWHVPSADHMVLPKGTAHVTDVGMCGSLHSSLGVVFDAVVPRWRDGKRTNNTLDGKLPWQFNAVLVDIDVKTGLAKSIKRVQQIIETL
jgi:2',3'-cyclic-nucleotide 2'-phosphodiesterase